MASISQEVKKIIEETPFLIEGLGRGLIHHTKLADQLKTRIERATGKPTNESAIVMALRRYEADLKTRTEVGQASELGCEIMMKTRISDFNVNKNPKLLNRLKDLYAMPNLGRGDFLNVTVGNHEVAITISQKYHDEVLRFLHGEEILQERSDLVALTIIFAGDFINTPGIVYQVLRRLAWENINLLEMISTLTELTVVIEKKDSTKGYEVLQRLTERLSGED